MASKKHLYHWLSACSMIVPTSETQCFIDGNTLFLQGKHSVSIVGTSVKHIIQVTMKKGRLMAKMPLLCRVDDCYVGTIHRLKYWKTAVYEENVGM